MISVRSKIDWSVNFFRSIHIWFVVFGENMPSISSFKVDDANQVKRFIKWRKLFILFFIRLVTVFFSTVLKYNITENQKDLLKILAILWEVKGSYHLLSMTVSFRFSRCYSPHSIQTKMVFSQQLLCKDWKRLIQIQWIPIHSSNAYFYKRLYH